MLSLGVNPEGLMKITAAFIQWKSENPTKPKGRESIASRPSEKCYQWGMRKLRKRTNVWGRLLSRGIK